MKAKYFIPISNKKSIEVSKGAHEEWKKKSAFEFEHFKKFANGYKEAYLNFVGMKEPGRRKILFEVRTIWKGYDGEIINTPLDWQTFSSYKEALECYELYLIMDGGYEEKISEPV